MWIFSVIIAFLIFLSMFFNGAEEESVFILAGLVLGIIIRMGITSDKLAFELKKLEKKYNLLEEEFKKFKSTLKTEKVDEVQELVEEVQTNALEMEPVEKAEISLEPPAHQVKEVSHENTSKESSKPLVADKGLDIDKLVSFVISYMKQGNPLVKVGGVLLFFGLSFLIKFAAEKDMVSTEMGVISSIIFGIVLIGLGWKHRARKGSFGLILQGVGISIFYLSIFSSAKYFDIIPFSLALAIMIIAVIFASFLAVAQNSLSLALFATVGGFLSPIITSTGEGSHIVLFSYYALLNIGIIFISWFKSWRVLNLSGFAFTFVISLFWGVQRYTPEFFWSTEPFLIFFFLLYVGVSIIFAFKSEYKIKAYVDSSLLFGVPATAFAMQAALVKDTEYALSFSALVVASFYLSLSWWLRKKEDMSLLAESFLALGVVFVTLAVPFALSGHWTAVTWTLESTAIIWISLRQERFYARIFAVTLQLVAGVTFFTSIFLHVSHALVFNNIFIGGLIVSIAAFLTSFVFEKNIHILKTKEKYFSFGFLLLALAWWLFTGVKEIETHFEYLESLVLIFISLSALVFFFISRRLQFKALEEILFYFFPLALLVLFFSVDLFAREHPLAQVGYLSIPLFFAVHYFLLYKIDWKQKHYWHEIGLWNFVLIFTSELAYHVANISESLVYVSYPLVPLAAIFLITPKIDFWPLNVKYKNYHELGLMGIFIMLILINISLFTKDAGLEELPYIPFVNPLDMVQISSVLAMIYWLKTLKTGLLSEKRSVFIFMGTASILILSVILARSVHYYFEVVYQMDYLLSSDVFQAGISILYTLISLALIVFAKRISSREVWIVGASLLGFVTLKLFFVELSHTGTLSRIISFMSVGVIILLIGYLAPLPPKKENS